jgi:hypothetical protein
MTRSASAGVVQKYPSAFSKLMRSTICPEGFRRISAFSSRPSKKSQCGTQKAQALRVIQTAEVTATSASFGHTVIKFRIVALLFLQR